MEGMYDAVEFFKKKIIEHAPMARGVASGGGDRVHKAQRSEGPVIAYWQSEALGHLIRVVGRSLKRGRYPRY